MSLDLQSLPKAELHCHVDGIITPSMLAGFEQEGHVLPLASETLKKAYPIQGYDDFIRWFDTTKLLDGDMASFRLILARYIEHLKTQNVIYAEIMLGSSELPRDDGRLIEEFGEFREYINTLEDGKIQVEFLVAVGRGVPLERFEWVAERVIRLRRENLLFGIALAGWPETPIRPFSHTLSRLHHAGVGIEIHAGEWAGPESVYDALEYGSPDRIGHGNAIFQNPELLERVQREGIHIEMCPTSNLKTGSVARIEDHSIRLARDLGMNYSVNTDDPGPFENSMLTEYELLAETFGFERSDFEAVYANALTSRFQPELRYL